MKNRNAVITFIKWNHPLLPLDNLRHLDENQKVGEKWPSTPQMEVGNNLSLHTGKEKVISYRKVFK